MPHYFLKLIPPRPSFPEDMDEREKEIMGRHADYLARLLRDGRGVAFGPVFDPSGIFGMGIVKTADEAAARALTDMDPAVSEGVGRYDIFPMRLLQA